MFECQQTQHGRNTIKVLQDYCQKQGSTVNQVLSALEEINRPDALDELKDGLSGNTKVLLAWLGQLIQAI